MAKTPSKNRAVKACPMPDRQSVSVSVRKIKNGYVISKSQDGPKGYSYTEEFTPTRPKLEIPTTTAPKGRK